MTYTARGPLSPPSDVEYLCTDYAATIYKESPPSGVPGDAPIILRLTGEHLSTVNIRLPVSTIINVKLYTIGLVPGLHKHYMVYNFLQLGH